ncbi:MAG: cell wall-binding repeat-containing protein [Thermoleophilaceae bacterium]|nr:cell wall-binding repeat-containing protein [Thermoleophilaceae bacterium]
MKFSLPRRVSQPTPQVLAATAVVVLLCLGLSGCSLGDDNSLTKLSNNSSGADFARGAGSPALATKNTVRIPGAGPVGNAAGAAISVYPSNDVTTRPKLVTVVANGDWRGAVAAGSLMARPIQAPVLIGKPKGQYDVTKSALQALNPNGLRVPGKVVNPKVLTIGPIELPEGTASQQIKNANPEEMAAQIDLFRTTVTSTPAPEVIIASSQEGAALYSLPAGPLAAKTGSPVLFVNGPIIPRATLRALELHRKPRIYVIGPEAIIPEAVVSRLKRFGSVKRISGVTAAENSVAVARFPESDSPEGIAPVDTWGWGANDPGHGLVIANASHIMDVAGATQLSASGAYGPLLLNGTSPMLDPTLENYLLDIQPGFIDDPTRGVYNRAWLLGDETALSPGLQARVDALCEIQPIDVSAPTGGAKEAF